MPFRNKGEIRIVSDEKSQQNTLAWTCSKRKTKVNSLVKENDTTGKLGMSGRSKSNRNGQDLGKHDRLVTFWFLKMCITVESKNYNIDEIFIVCRYNTYG